MLLDHKRGRRSLVSVSFVGSVLAVESLIHASPLHVPCNRSSAFLPLCVSCLLCRSLRSLLLILILGLCSSLSCGAVSIQAFPPPVVSVVDLTCLFPLATPSLLLPTPLPPPRFFVVYCKLKTKQIQIPPLHLTVQTERSAGVAAGAGAQGRARASAPPGRRGRRELPAGRPELLQSGGQQPPGPIGQQPPPFHPSFGCVVV